MRHAKYVMKKVAIVYILKNTHDLLSMEYINTPNGRKAYLKRLKKKLVAKLQLGEKTTVEKATVL